MGSVVGREQNRNLIEYLPFPLTLLLPRRLGRPSWRTTNLRRKKRRKWRQKRRKLGAQMRSERRAAAVRKKAVRTSAQAVRVNGKVTGMMRVTRVAAARMRAVRMRPELPGTKRRSSVVMQIQRTLTLMMRTEDGSMAVTMIQRVAVMGVANGAAAPVPSPVAVSTQLRRMAVRLQLLILVRPTVTVTKSFQGWRRHDYYVQEGTFPWCICEPFTLFPSPPPNLCC